MILYEYPPRLTRSGRQQKALHDLEEHKKMRSNMFKNLVLGAAIAIIGVTAKNIVVKILLIILGLGNIAVAALLYWYFAYWRQADVYTRIYEDHLEHSQRRAKGAYLEVVLWYDEVKKSWQTNSGVLVCELEDPKRSEFVLRDKNGGAKPLEAPQKAELVFQDTAAKLYLINELWEKIGYPHKEYNVIEDDDDYYSKEDMEWDKLHKHGL